MVCYDIKINFEKRGRRSNIMLVVVVVAVVDVERCLVKSGLREI